MMKINFANLHKSLEAFFRSPWIYVAPCIPILVWLLFPVRLQVGAIFVVFCIVIILFFSIPALGSVLTALASGDSYEDFRMQIRFINISRVIIILCNIIVFDPTHVVWPYFIGGSAILFLLMTAVKRAAVNAPHRVEAARRNRIHSRDW